MNTDAMKTETTIPTGSHNATPLYDWHYILRIAAGHRREIVLANLIAILAAITSVPVPLLLPLLVDEVLLDKPGVVSCINCLNEGR